MEAFNFGRILLKWNESFILLIPKKEILEKISDLMPPLSKTFYRK